MKKNCCEGGSCSLSDMEVVRMKELSKSSVDAVGTNVVGIAIKIFGKSDCDICKTATEKIEKYLAEIQRDVKTFHYNMDTLDGLTEAAVHSAFDVPTIIVEKNMMEIRRWKRLPSFEELVSVVGG